MKQNVKLKMYVNLNFKFIFSLNANSKFIKQFLIILIINLYGYILVIYYIIEDTK